MFFRCVKTEGLAQQSYVLECGSGTSVVVDPRRDIDAYLELARDNDLSIAYILETHRQEDFEYGSTELAQLTGAKIVSGSHECFGRSDVRLADGAKLEIETTRIVLLETPGHTPESVCYAVHPRETGPRCWGVFTGDTLFAGATGRTDLADPDLTTENAGVLYDSIHRQLGGLDDGTLIFAAHGPGSACGSNIAGRELTTLGIEKASNPAFTQSRARFMETKRTERLPRPPYFSHMERVNLHGGRPLGGRPAARMLQPKAFRDARKRALIIDTREPDAFAGSHIPDSYNIWLKGLSTFAGWITDEQARIALLVDSPDDIRTAELSLARIGLEQPVAVLAGGIAAWREQGFPVSRIGTVSAGECAEWVRRGGVRLLDVRDDSEWEGGHIAGAMHTYVGDLEARLPDASRAAKMVVYCSVGHRAGLAASILARAGFSDVYNMLGGMKAWRSLGLPLTTGP
jgi:hydroxyacylglutathione hydrolase